MQQTLAITRKELNSYFGSPMALIFVGVFLAATLFTFFWVDTFFARGIADLRPLFRWMPLLLIFLTSAVTMRQWSEEQSSGTLEVLLTLPVGPVQLVAGKFLAVLALLGVSLALTLFLPLTVELLGNLDWGPVVGGYIAALLLAGAYAALGLFVSSRTDNQIVALISTAVLGGVLYFIGAHGVVDFFGDRTGELLRAFGSGSRFESIERGVLDLRDLLYYVSLIGVFLSLNVLALDSKRWGKGANSLPYRQRMILTVVLVGANLAVLNVWLFPVTWLRVDLTAGREYSLSPATRSLLANLDEPLLVRGYFSAKTHPLLAPLVPRIRDMLTEYALASNGRVNVEVVDPLTDPEKEAEANQSYGIKPTPLQAADRYGASVVNAYFDILVRYGDQNVVLNFQDLIEVKASSNGQPDVRLRNLEYDLTRAVKKAVYGFQSIDAVLASLEQPATLTLYTTPTTLPEQLQVVPATIAKVAQEIAAASQGKFSFQQVQVGAPGAPTPDELGQKFGLRAFQASFFSPDTYFLHMVLSAGGESQVLFPAGDFGEASVRSTLETALKRGAKGFLKVVGIWTPPDVPEQDMFGQQAPSFKSYKRIAEALRENYTVQPVDLSTGQVGGNVDVLLLVAPQGLTDKDLFAVDQYLMRGGAVAVAAGSYLLKPDAMSGGLAVQEVAGGLAPLLEHYGVSVAKSLVLDLQNEPFPIQMARTVGGVEVREFQAMPYPYFVDVRTDGMDGKNPILANVAAVTLNWVSPITVDEPKNTGREVSRLLSSSAESWTTTNTVVQPDLQFYPALGFPEAEVKAPQLLAVAIKGAFESYYKGKQSPIETAAAAVPADAGAAADAPPIAVPQALGIIERSPATARLVVVGSAEFLNDVVFDLSRNLSGDRYLNSLQFAQNMVDWSVEDLELLGIRSRGTASHVLLPLTPQAQSVAELGNYGVALIALLVLAWTWQRRRRRQQPMVLLPPAVARKRTDVAAELAS